MKDKQTRILVIVCVLLALILAVVLALRYGPKFIKKPEAPFIHPETTPYPTIPNTKLDPTTFTIKTECFDGGKNYGVGETYMADNGCTLCECGQDVLMKCRAVEGCKK